MNVRNLLIVAATREEIAPLLSELNSGDLRTGHVHSCKRGQLPLDILITGPGMVATAYYLGKVRGLHEYSLVLNAGIAGSFRKTPAIGETVNVTQDCFYDLGVTRDGLFLPVYSMPMAKDYQAPFIDDLNMIRNTALPMLLSLNDLPRVSGVTVNSVTGKPWRKNPAFPDYTPQVETMEGAAFLLACLTTGVACAQIRAVSNLIGPAATWDLQAAVGSLHQTLSQLLDEL